LVEKVANKYIFSTKSSDAENISNKIRPKIDRSYPQSAKILG
jgi:hypothetical protein